MNGADLAILGIVAISAIVGLLRGFIKEVFSLATWAAAMFLSMLFGMQVGELLPLDPALNPWVTRIAGGALVFILVLISGGLATHFLSHVAKATGLSGTDRTLGSVFGLLRGCIIVLAVLIFLPAAGPVNESDWWLQSKLIPEFLAFENRAMEVLDIVIQWISTLFSGT